MAKRPKKQEFFTPIGVFKYVHLNKPDTGTDQYPKDPEFNVTVAYDKDSAEAAELIGTLEPLVAKQEAAAEEAWEAMSGKNKAALKKKGVTEPVIMPFYNDEVDDDGEPTGRVLFRFKTKAQFKTKDGSTVKKVVPLVDAFGQIIKGKKRPLVYAGTEGRIAFTVGYSFIPKDGQAFMSFYLNQVQITDLATGGGARSAFGAVEGASFSADDLDEYGEDEDTDDTDVNDDGDDDDLDDEIPF